jgi:hypothetical protein
MLHATLLFIWNPICSPTTRELSTKEILPLLRKQNCFKDEITFSNPRGNDVTAVSLWDNKASAEAYNTNSYPEVLKTIGKFIEGTPRVQTSDVVNSTFHKLAHATA